MSDKDEERRFANLAMRAIALHVRRPTEHVMGLRVVRAQEGMHSYSVVTYPDLSPALRSESATEPEPLEVDHITLNWRGGFRLDEEAASEGVLPGEYRVRFGFNIEKRIVAYWARRIGEEVSNG